ncbi:MAG TPA: cytochrome-c oxidase, cbb3-type subunit III [Burkholderiaceae bacterium]|nr:cytochrome-c oxidase, cbb3-type subunit III [Burkholderiaceae bacterium]
MSDFVSTFWDYYVALLTLISVLACAVLLKVQSKHRVKRTGAESSKAPVPTTGHVWDGDIRELNQPMPRWWMWLFYLTIVFSLGYLVLYPGLGTVFKGTLAWTSEGEHARDVAQAAQRFGPLYDAYLAQDLVSVSRDARAMQMGERLFQNNCAACHGADGRGGLGFPNLTDEEWLYGSSAEAIELSISQGRAGMMPALGAAIGGDQGVSDMVQYVLSLSGRPHDASAAQRAQGLFAVCAGCHGMDGRGNAQIGAPDLTNAIWLYGGTPEAIAQTIAQGRQGVMPAHSHRLTPGQIHIVAAYVLSLGGASQ